MKILYISDMGFEGYLPSGNYPRPHLSWINALGAYHIHHSKVNTIQEKFDIAIVASLHENASAQIINLDNIRYFKNNSFICDILIFFLIILLI